MTPSRAFEYRGSTPPPAAILEAMHDILASREFVKSSQLGRLLSALLRAHTTTIQEGRHGLSQAEEGRHTALPQSATSNALVERMRLNFALECYYDGSGKRSQVRIEFVGDDLTPRFYCPPSIGHGQC